MLPTIIYGGSQADRAGEVAKLLTPKTKLVHLTSPTTSILIAQIHSLTRSLALTSPSPRLVWLEEAQTMTTPAQNAILKILEEPPFQTRFLLTAPSKTALLPTILSRCSALKITSSPTPNNDSELALLKQAIFTTPGSRLLLANSLGGKRPALLAWTEAVLRSLENKLTPSTPLASLKILSQIGALTSLSHTQLSANCNPPLTIQNLFLSLPHKNSRSA